jgi:hypothetical protein
MNELLVGYARVSTEQQDLTAQRNGLHALGVGDDRIYVDHGLTGTNRDRPGLRLALYAGALQRASVMIGFTWLSALTAKTLGTNGAAGQATSRPITGLGQRDCEQT